MLTYASQFAPAQSHPSPGVHSPVPTSLSLHFTDLYPVLAAATVTKAMSDAWPFFSPPNVYGNHNSEAFAVKTVEEVLFGLTRVLG